MATRVDLVQNNTGPPLTVSLMNEDSAGPIDVSLATSIVMFFMAQGSTTILDTLTGTPTTGFLNEDDQLITAGYATPGTGGRIIFNWNPTTLAVSPGAYIGSVQITFANGVVQTVPEYLYFYVRPAP